MVSAKSSAAVAKDLPPDGLGKVSEAISARLKQQLEMNEPT